MKLLPAVMAEKSKSTEKVNIAMEQGLSSPKRNSRLPIILAATTFAVLAVAGIVVGTVYLGHVMTQQTYQEARMFYLENEGAVVEEKVQITEEEVDFEAEGRFTVVYDFKNKLVIIRPMDKSGGDKCFMTNLTPDMGTMEEIRERINSARESGGFATNMERTANFVATNKTVNIPSTSTKASKMCGGLPVLWIERADESEQRGLVKRQASCDRTVVVVIIIIIREDSCTIIVAEFEVETQKEAAQGSTQMTPRK